MEKNWLFKIQYGKNLGVYIFFLLFKKLSLDFQESIIYIDHLENPFSLIPTKFVVIMDSRIS